MEIRRSRTARLVQIGSVLVLLASVLIQLATVTTSSAEAGEKKGHGDKSAESHNADHGNGHGEAGNNGKGPTNGHENNGNAHEQDGQGNNGKGHENDGHENDGHEHDDKGHEVGEGKGHGHSGDHHEAGGHGDSTAENDDDGDEAHGTDETEYVEVATASPGQPGIDVEKFVVTQYGAWHDADTEADGPGIPRGDDLLWIYVVSNWGDVDLEVTLHDDVEGSITCPQTTLAAGEVMHCELAGVAVGGHYMNTAHVVGDPGDDYSYDVEDRDDAHYTGLEGGITIEKYTNGHDADEAPGPTVVIGDTVVWTYVFTNTGEVPLYGVRVHDDTEDVVVCDDITLLVGETKKCELTGTVQAGQYMNTGHVVGDYGVIWEMDDDASHYYGAPAPTTTTAAETSSETVVTPTTEAPTTTAAPTTTEAPTTTTEATTTTTEKTEVLATSETAAVTTTTSEAPVVSGSLPVTGSNGTGLGLQGFLLVQLGAGALLAASLLRRRDRQAITLLPLD